MPSIFTKLFATILFTIVLCQAAIAGEEAVVACSHDCCDATDNGCACCCCPEVCVASTEKKTIEKHCWKVTPKKICVPKVVCPWSEGGSGLTCFDLPCFNWLAKKRGPTCCGMIGCCCPKRCCGKVLCVRDLKKVTYECEKSVCQWEIHPLTSCGDDCGDDCGCCEVAE